MEIFGYPSQELLFLAPEILLAVAGLLLLLLGSGGRGLSGREASLVAGSSLVLAGWLVLRVQAALEGRESLALLDGLFVLDGVSFLVQLLVLVSTLLTVLLSVPSVEAVEGSARASRSSALLLLAAAGLLVLASGTDLLVLWIALEAAALASVLLAGSRRPARSGAGRLASLLPEVLSSGLVLTGLALLAAAAGTLRLDALGRALAEVPSRGAALVPLAWWLVAAGLFFRTAAVPLRVWKHAGEAPTPIVAFLATAFRTAPFVLLLRVVRLSPGNGGHWQPVVAAMAAAALIGGSCAALKWDGARRTLAAGSIAHTGFLLAGLLVVDATGLPAVLFYLLASTFAILGAQGSEVLRERRASTGSAGRAAGPTASTLLFLLALAGLPLTGGFVGRLDLLAAVLQGWPWLALAGALASALALAAVLRLLAPLGGGEAEPEIATSRAPAVLAAIVLCAAMTLALGLVPEPFLAWTEALGRAAAK